MTIMDRSEHKLIPTRDGSLTLHLGEYKENMHSLSGAYEEALLKHVLPSGVLEKNGGLLKVLDVGFGLGYNALALVVEYLRTTRSEKLYIISLEKDRSLLPILSSIRFGDIRDDAYALIKEAYKEGAAQHDSIELSV